MSLVDSDHVEPANIQDVLRARWRARYQRNKERILAYRKKYRTQNYSRVHKWESKSRNRADAKERKNRKAAERRKLNKERTRQENVEYRKTVAYQGSQKKYRTSELYKATMTKYQGMRRSLTLITDIDSKWLAESRRKTIQCPICGKLLENHGRYPNGKHLDHIIPIFVGGGHFKHNVRYICAECNIARPRDGSDIGGRSFQFSA